MAQNLQGRIQLLGILLAVFILLSLPLFAQVRADAAQSAERGDDTILGRFFRDLVKDLKGDAKDIQAEDVYGRWKEQHPDCAGAQCGPDGDLDGDGMSNRDELERGRNPECNEEKEGVDTCRGQTPTTTPTGSPTGSTTPTYIPPLNDLIYDKTVRVTFSSPHSESKPIAKVTPDYTRWQASWSITGYSGTGTYTITIRNDTQTIMSENRPISGVNQGAEDSHELPRPPPSGAPYVFEIRSNDAGLDGTWHLTVRGIREARST